MPNFRWAIICLLTAPIFVYRLILEQNLLCLSKKGGKINFNSLLIANFDLTEKIGKGVTN